MNILDNELVKKYFGDCEHGERPERGSASAWHVRVCMADKVLRAMQEPIRKGERYLLWKIENLSWVVCDNVAVYDSEGFHPYALRLPDKFQKRECECECHHPEHQGYPPQRDVVEEKIREIMRPDHFAKAPWSCVSEDQLRELVRLARGGT